MSSTQTRDFDLTALLPGTHYCTACAERVCDALRRTPGVSEAVCDLPAGTLSVTTGGREALSGNDLEETVKRIALEATGSVAHAAYRLSGLD